MGRLACFFGFHSWRRSRFVVLGSLEEDMICRRCWKVTALRVAALSSLQATDRGEELG